MATTVAGAVSVAPTLAQDAADEARAAAQELARAAGAPAAVRWSAHTGLATFVTMPAGRAPRLVPPAASAAGRAQAFVAAYGRLFGLRDLADVEVARVEGPDLVGMEHVRLQQRQDGVPVTGGELFVHLRGGALVAANGKTLPPQHVNPVPGVPAAVVVERVLAALGAELDLAGATVTAPRLELFNRGLLEDRASPTQLAWFVEATTPERWEFIWIDAQRGDVLLHFNQMPDALDRRIHDAMSTPELPGTLVRSEGDLPTGDAEIDRAYDYSGDTYDYFFTEHGRDSFDDAGGTMIATVRSCLVAECPMVNAFWTSTQTRFGAGWVADDVVAHEWTHGVVQYSTGWFYFAQFGALNESFADLFGETIDLGNGAGLDTPEVRWWIFEEMPENPYYPPPGLRYMMDPTLQDDPGKLSDPQLVCNLFDGDNGGVHTNSGVPNHAYALMVDGGTYNGFTVAGIGLTKAGKIEYRALTQYLGTVSNFRDDYDALVQACADLIGTVGITAADCGEVRKALDAVEMHDAWPCYCGNGLLDGAGEQCDDGNNTDGDCCSSRCAFEPAGSPCDDARLCTSGDACDGAGVCGSGMAHPGCRGAQKSLLLIKDSGKDARDKLLWKWLKGAATTAEDFGVPTGTTAYTLCLFAGTAEALIADATIPPDAAKWVPTEKGYKYKDASGAPQGIQGALLKSGAAGKAKVLVKGKGGNLPMPNLGTGLPLPVRAQLLNNSNDVCFEGRYDAGAVSENGGSQFKAKAE